MREVPNTISLAYGDQKAKALLSVLKANYINHLVTDEATILKVLELDGDQQFTKNRTAGMQSLFFESNSTNVQNKNNNQML